MDNKEIFRNWFYKTNKEQFEIRQKMVGQQIVAAFYSPFVDGWDIEIKDETIFHIPMGFITLQLSDNNYYRINTSYQSWCGGIFGILIEPIDFNKFSETIFETDKAYFNSNKNWSTISNSELLSIDWNWKREPNCKLDGQTLTLNQAENYLYEDCFVPDNLVFHFSNGETIYFFSLEPDAEIVNNKTYTLISGGEEIMVFFKADRLKKWEINTLGFEILIDGK